MGNLTEDYDGSHGENVKCSTKCFFPRRVAEVNSGSIDWTDQRSALPEVPRILESDRDSTPISATDGGLYPSRPLIPISTIDEATWGAPVMNPYHVTVPLAAHLIPQKRAEPPATFAPRSFHWNKSINQFAAPRSSLAGLMMLLFHVPLATVSAPRRILSPSPPSSFNAAI
uniref:Uncharacterized protein n=1 Tax=Steinernema glaseri TaxID=37863 RepID=A0A1I7YWY8_9BILA